jgi:integrase/recombinase XerD
MTATQIASLREEYLLPFQAPTLRAYTRGLELWFDWCTSHSLRALEVRRVDVERYVQHLVACGGMPASVRFRLAPVRGFYRFAYLEDLVPRDPAALARLPRVAVGPNSARCLDRREMRAFLDLGDRLGGSHQALAYLLGCLGLRNSEACSVQVEDIAGTVRGQRVLEFVGKGGKSARIPLPPPIVRALGTAAQGRASGPLLVGQRGRPLRQPGLRLMVGRMGVDAGITCTVYPHLLRASCITNALDSGAPLARVQELARHADPQTTMRYDRNRTNLDDHAVHSLVSYLTPRDEDEGTNRGRDMTMPAEVSGPQAGIGSSVGLTSARRRS